MTERTEKTETTGAGTSSTQKWRKIKNRFSSKNVAMMALFVALSFVVSLLDFSIIPSAPFLKLDFGNVFILLISFLLGPVEGVIVCLLKEGLRCFNSESFYAGEIANFLITSSFLLLPSILYQRRKNLKTVLITLSISCLIATGVALVANRFIVFPVYAIVMNGSIFGMTVAEAFSALWGWILLFNLIKTVSVSLFTILLYKRLSNFFKKMR